MTSLLPSELGAIGDFFWSLSVSSEGKGNETFLSIHICGLPCTFMRAISLYVKGSLGHNCLVDCVD